jgi:hypothetical protein
MSETRNDCYIYSKDERKKVDIKTNRALRELLINRPELQQYIPELDDGTSINEISDVYQVPILFMQILGGVASGGKYFNKIDFFLGSYSAEKYDNSATKMSWFTINTGNMKPHYVDAYIILCDK